MRERSAQQELTGKTVVVVGGSGGVGEGVVRELLARGARVLAAGRSPERLVGLRRAIGADSERLHTVELDATAEDLDRRVRDLAEQFGPFDGVVVAVASWGDQGRRAALSLTDEQWDALLAANLTSVFRLFRSFLPVTAQTGVILQLNGMSADLPFPGAAGVALSAAASKSLTRTIAAEMGGRGPRFYQLILGVVRTRARQAAGIDDPRWLEGEEIGSHIAGLISGESPLVAATVQYFTDRQIGPQAGPGEG
jgi:NAD(P)-dependent dehydrogenase (short-subunit alcohol dehydrogenase family)